MTNHSNHTGEPAISDPARPLVHLWRSFLAAGHRRGLDALELQIALAGGQASGELYADARRLALLRGFA